MKWPLASVVVFGCFLEILGVGATACTAVGAAPAALLILGLFVFYGIGYGALTSALPVVATAGLAQAERPAFMQNFFATLAAGAILGILVAGVLQTWDLYIPGFA